MKKEAYKLPYINDGLLYSIWIYLNGFKLKGKNLLNFDDLTACEERGVFSVVSFFNRLKDLGINSLNELTFHKDIYLKYNKKRYEELKNDKESGTLNDLSLSALGFIEKLIAGNVSFLYENSHGIFDFIFYENILRFLEFFEFSTDLPLKDREKITNSINGYIKNFINDNLQKETQNFYCFSEQKKRLFFQISMLTKKYGNNFILQYPKEIDIVMGNKDKECLFIHTLIALETLGYIEIENIWIFDMNLAPEEQTENYKVKLTLKEKFFDNEREAMFGIKKKIETKKDIKKDLIFNNTKSILLFNNTEIKISKTRNSNGHYLLKTIFKNKNKIWEYDEIAEDWTDDYKKDDWSRYYNAGYTVNEKVAKETTIKDFLVITNKTVGINKKYL